LLEPWLPHPGLAMIHAQRGDAKTWLGLSIGKSIAARQELLGWRCPRYGRVLYVDGELPGRALQRRLDMFRRSPPGAFHLLSRDRFIMRRQLMPDLATEAGQADLDRIINECRPDLVILDSLSTLVRSGVENEAESWGPTQNWLLKHRWQGRTMLFVHHEGIASGRGRGTSKREDVLDTVIGLKRNWEASTNEESAFELRFTKARDFYGDDAAPKMIYLSVRDGQVTWRHERIKDVQREKIRELLDAGAKQKDIAREIGVTPARVSQLVTELKRDNVVRFSRKGARDES
jgi:putative DNA primase/helicase